MTKKDLIENIEQQFSENENDVDNKRMWTRLNNRCNKTIILLT